jgi:pyruvate formate lyase activating enzyme
MDLGGFQKLSLLNYPEKTACTVFTAGCNFRCPWCHNSGLVQGITELISQREILEYLTKRRGLLEGICISGGEPLMRDDLPDFIRSVNDLEYAVKLDTNGSFPDQLEAMIAEGLIDYVAMDVKNAPEKYAETIGLSAAPVDKILRSAKILRDSGIAYEFRTTVIREFHTAADIEAIAQMLEGASVWYLQPFRDAPEVEWKGLHAPYSEEMEKFGSIGNRYLKTMIRK